MTARALLEPISKIFPSSFGPGDTLCGLASHSKIPHISSVRLIHSPHHLARNTRSLFLKWFLPNFAFACLWFGNPSPIEAENSIKRSAMDFANDRVVVIHSYHYGFTWSDSISEGIRAEFAEDADEAEVKFEFLDTRFNAAEDYLDRMAQTLEAKYRNRKVDVVIASDDHALNFILVYGERIFTDVPVVFCCVSGFSHEMRRQLDLTGLRESIDIHATVNAALRLHPGTKEIAVVLDKSRTGQALKKKTEDALGSSYKGAAVRYLENFTESQLQVELRKLPPHTVVLLYIFRPDATGRVLSHEQNLRRLRPYCPYPIYSVWQFYLGHGIVGGRLSNGREEGRMVARLAIRVLSGERASEIPLSASPVKFMFDYKEMVRFGLKLDRLPRNSLLINKPHSFYQMNKTLIWNVIVVFCLLVVGLIGVSFGLIKSRRAEKNYV